MCPRLLGLANGVAQRLGDAPAFRQFPPPLDCCQHVGHPEILVGARQRQNRHVPEGTSKIGSGEATLDLDEHELAGHRRPLPRKGIEGATLGSDHRPFNALEPVTTIIGPVNRLGGMGQHHPQIDLAGLPTLEVDDAHPPGQTHVSGRNHRHELAGAPLAPAKLDGLTSVEHGRIVVETHENRLLVGESAENDEQLLNLPFVDIAT